MHIAYIAQAHWTRRVAAQRLQETRKNTSFGQRHFDYLAVRFFNLLPELLRDKVNNKKFKFLLKRYLFEMNSDSVIENLLK